MPFRDLREFLGLLDKKRELLRVKKAVDTRFEIFAYIRETRDRLGAAQSAA